jgi:hypothetical protein
MDTTPPRRSRKRHRGKAALVVALLPVALLVWMPISSQGTPITTHSAQTSWAHARVVEDFCPSGCPQTQRETVVIHQQNSDLGIFRCEQLHPGDRTGRANCMLDIVRYVCGSQPFPHWTIIPAEPSFDFRQGAECTRATDHIRSGQMASAISLVTGSYECLRYVRLDHWSPSHSITRNWTASNSGTYGCPG